MKTLLYICALLFLIDQASAQTRCQKVGKNFLKGEKFKKERFTSHIKHPIAARIIGAIPEVVLEQRLSLLRSGKKDSSSSNLAISPKDKPKVEVANQFINKLKLRYGSEFDLHMFYFYKAKEDGCDVKLTYVFEDKTCMLNSDDSQQIIQNAQKCMDQFRQCMSKSNARVNDKTYRVAAESCVKESSMCKSFDSGTKVDTRYCANLYVNKNNF